MTCFIEVKKRTLASTLLRKTCPLTPPDCLCLGRLKTACPSVDPLSKNPGDFYHSTDARSCPAKLNFVLKTTLMR